MDDLDAIKQVFFEECDEQLVLLEQELGRYVEDQSDPETINAIFRAVHSIKGGAGAFGLEVLVRFSHAFETMLDRLRSGTLEPSRPLLDVCFQATDILSDLVMHARGQGVFDPVRRDEVMSRLTAACEAEVESDPDDPFAGLSFTPVAVELPDVSSASVQRWVLDLRPVAEFYASGDDIRNVLLALARVGRCDVTLRAADVPLLADLAVEAGYLNWVVSLETEASEGEVREVLEWSLGGLEFGLRLAEPTGVVAEVCDPVVKEVPEPTRAVRPVMKSAGTSIRVDLERVDRLVDLVGELVIHEAGVRQRLDEASLNNAAPLALALSELEALTRDLQDGVMAMRAQPIGGVFQRMSRVVREAALATGKQVRLVLSGENTEVDRSIIEHLADPLTHMIRNAVDHGIEMPGDRERSGKPAEGEIRLSAQHRSGRIVIEIVDDGGGISPERVLAKAIERGLVAEDAGLTHAEIYDLIFAPGFSTASTISDLSGRGVGMDVVRRAITGLGGRVIVNSVPGAGSTFVLSLPLTLAVLDGMIFRVEDRILIAPLSHVVESVKVEAGLVHSLDDGSRVFLNRGLYFPVIDIGACLCGRAAQTDDSISVLLVVEDERGQRAALAVDQIVKQSQVVIKSIEKNYRPVEGISGATVLGNGAVGLIVDIDALMRWKEKPRHNGVSNDLESVG